MKRAVSLNEPRGLKDTGKLTLVDRPVESGQLEKTGGDDYSLEQTGATKKAIAPVRTTKVAPVEKQKRSKALDALAQSYGVQLSFENAWKKQEYASAEALRALLSAMLGVPLDTDAQVKAALKTHETKVWSRPLEAVQVVQPDRPEITLRVPASDAGVELTWSVAGKSGRVRAQDLKVIQEQKIDGTLYRQYALPLPNALELGRHTLRLEKAGATIGTMSVIAAPDACYMPEPLRGDQKKWGVGIQLYALRSSRSWGMGDFTDLSNLTPVVARRGASLIGLNPLHAAFAHNPDQCSPYSASSKLFVNPLYLDPQAIADYARSPEVKTLVESSAFQEKLAALNKSERIDYRGIAEAKMPVLELIYAAFRKGGDQLPFQRFVAEKGEDLERFARFEALREHFAKLQPDRPHWGAWPEAYQDPTSTEVRLFAEAHGDRLDFHKWLQFQCDVQLKAAESRGKAEGLKLGLYRDLAVSTDRYGADTWAQKSIYGMSVSVGAPPEPGNPPQNWGLPPRLPEQMKENAYAAFGSELHQNMPQGGVIRADHAASWERLYCLPTGPNVKEGAYVGYSRNDLLGVVALESQKNKTLVIAEDLGTMPEGFSDELMSKKILSYRLLPFEWNDGGVRKRPREYPEMAIVAAGNHDVATLAGWWSGFDLEWRNKLGQYPNVEAYAREKKNRIKDKKAMVDALAKEGLLPRDLGKRAAIPNLKELPESLNTAIHAFLSRTPCKLMMVQLEDVLGMKQAANLPGTLDEHPNWRVPLAATLEEIDQNAHFDAIAEALTKRR